MRLLDIFSALSTASLAAAGSHHLPKRDYATNDYYAIHVSPSTSPADLAAHLGLAYEGPFGSIDDHHVFRAPKHDNDLVEDARQELMRRRRKREIGLD